MTKVKLLLLALILLSLPLSAFTQDIGDGTGIGGACSSSCARKCANGYWSSIGCLSNQCAHCPCGDPPYPYCT